MCRLASVPLSHVRSTRAAGGMSLKISYSASVRTRFVDETLRLLRSTCVHATCPTRNGRTPSWIRPPRAGPRWARASGCAALSPSCPFSSSGVSCRAPGTGAGPAPAAAWRRSKALVADPHRRVAGVMVRFGASPPCAASQRPSEAGPSPCDAACGIRAGAGPPSSARPAPNRTDPRSTPRSSAVSAGRDGTTRSRWTRTTGRASARVTPWTCPGRFPPRSSGRSDAARNAADQDPLLGRQVRILS